MENYYQYRLLLLLSFFLSSKIILAQDVHYTPFNETPLVVNPAFAGQFDGKFRATTLFSVNTSYTQRTFNNYGLSVDMPIVVGKKGDFFGLGAQLMDTKVENTTLETPSANLAFSFHKYLMRSITDSSEQSFEIGGGIGLSTGRRLTDLAGDFFAPKGIHYGWLELPLGNMPFNTYYAYPPDDFMHTNLNYFTANAGLSLKHKVNTRLNYTIGIAAFNLNQPDDSHINYQNETVGLDRRYTGAVSISWQLSGRFTINPSFYGCTSKNYNGCLAGGDLYYNVSMRNVNRSVFAGMVCRNDGAKTITGGVVMHNFRLGLGYQIRQYNGYGVNNGGAHIALRFVLPGASARK